MDIQEIGCGYIDWIELAEGRGKWLAVVKKVMEIRLFRYERNFLNR
jgi:hypothetical protein